MSRVYPAEIIEAKEGGFVITFRDVPEAITQSDTFKEALINAKDALITALEFYHENNLVSPIPSRTRNLEINISLPVSADIKLALLDKMVEKGINKAELAKRMNVRPQEITRITKLTHSTKIDTLDRYL